MSALAELLIVIGIDPKKAELAVEHLQEKVKENFKEMGKHVLEFMGVVGGMEEFAHFFEETIKGQTEINRLSKEFHIGSEEISTFQIAAERCGGSAQATNGSITALGEKLSVLGTKMRGARMSAMALGMALGYEGKQAEEMGIKTFKGMKAPEAMKKLAESMHGMEFGKAMKLGQMAGIDQGTIRLMTKTKEEYEELMEHAKKFAATQEETEASEHFEEAQKDMASALHKVGMVIVEKLLPPIQWLMDKLVDFAQMMAKHEKLATVVASALGGLGLAFLAAAGHAVWAWASMHLAVLAKVPGIVAGWFSTGTAAKTAGGEFEGAAVKSSRSWLGMVADAAKSLGKVVAGWALAGWTALKAGIQMAAAWVMGLGPVAWIIAGIAAVIAIFVGLEMKFHIFSKLWGMVKDAAKASLGWIWDKLKTIGSMIAHYATVWGKLLTGDFKGALKAGVDMVKDTGHLVGMDSGAGLPAYAGATTGAGSSGVVAHHVVHHVPVSSAQAVPRSAITHADNSTDKRTVVNKHTQFGDIHVVVTEQTGPGIAKNLDEEFKKMVANADGM